MRRPTALAISLVALAGGWATKTTSGFVQTPGASRIRMQPPQHRSFVAMDPQLDQQNNKSSHVQSLWVFVHTLQKERREKGPQRTTAAKRRPAASSKFHSAKSLAIFLNNNRFAPTENVQQVEPFSRAVVQAIRLASELGDYKLILHLVEASIEYANGHAIIMPRVFGEAIDGISKTSANMNKIKKLWKLGASEESKTFLTEPLGAFELNVMIKAIASRGKIRGALDLYQEHTTTSAQPTIVPDAYTLSSIFSALQDSITDDQQASSNSTQSQSSQCWQWKQAMGLLTSYLKHDDWPTLNNHVFSSLLKLNDRVSQAYQPSAHNGPKMALFLLNTMHQLNISPDVVTCTLIISNLGYQWKTAINLLYAMKTTPSTATTAEQWKLPRPNVYTYSAVITICAHCHQYQAAMELLEEMKTDPNSDNPNTWVYNAALLATTRSDSLAVLTAEPATSEHPTKHQSAPKQKRSRERLFMALQLLREMQLENGDNCRPDTVTYNTVLATLDGIASPNDLEGLDEQYATHLKPSSRSSTYFEEDAVHGLLDEMTQARIPRDSITYRNALLAIRFSPNIRASVGALLERALNDGDSLSVNTNNQKLEGKAAHGIAFVFDTAMTVLSSHGDVHGVLDAFDQMMKQPSSRSRQGGNVAEKLSATQVHFVQSLGRAKDGSSSALIPVFLNATMGDSVARLAVSKEYPGMDSRLLMNHGDNEALFSAAISSCLVANNIDNARKVLSLMRSQGLQPSELSLTEIARTYARLAVIAAAEETKNTEESKSRNSNSKSSKSINTAVQKQHAVNSTSVAAIRAKNAYTIATKTLSDPPASLLSTVARTCASLGMWAEASNVLKKIHKRIPLGLGSNEISNIGSIGAAQTVLPGLHRALLRASSIQGNVTAALWFVDDIQKLSKRLAHSTKEQPQVEEDGVILSPSLEKTAARQSDQAALLSPDNSLDHLGMAGEDWKLLMIAASKSGHWRVCLTTLQFMRPFLEETHPSSLGITVEERSRRYGHLAPALTVALKCLEVRSQYGWAVRAIDDWIDWCGRRPPKEAVLAAIRIMSKRGRGAEVISLLERCTGDDGAALLSYGNNEGNYELALYVGAITALHNEGLYDDADDAFIAAVRGNFLPFDLQSETVDGKQRIVLDLHGMNVPVAHSAVRVALQHEVELASWIANPSDASSDGVSSGNVWDNDMVIVTGRGKNSALRMRPVLRPEVQRMLVEEFYPPLGTASIPGNMGAVRVPADDIQKWLSHQRQQKGSRMLAVASVLRSMSSIDRIRQSLAKKIQAEESEKSTEEEGN